MCRKRKTAEFKAKPDFLMKEGMKIVRHITVLRSTYWHIVRRSLDCANKIP